LSKSASISAYDYHGPWDRNLSGEDGTAKPHTSTLDILDSMRLYTRAGVDFNKRSYSPSFPVAYVGSIMIVDDESNFAVNLGLAWYGRTFAVGNCIGTRCLVRPTHSF
jgi:GH18 family chitinase